MYIIRALIARCFGMLLIEWIALLDSIYVTYFFMIGRYASFARSDWYTLKGIMDRFQVAVPLP